VPVFDEPAVRAAMADVGYRRIKRHIYRAEWSTADVEHFVYFQLWGVSKAYLSADFGVRNKEATSFAVRSIKAYGGQIYQIMRHDDRTDCVMVFSLGQLASWAPRHSLRWLGMPSATLSETIKRDIGIKLLPLMQSVTSLDSQLSFLLEDTEEHAWIYSNGAIRAAIIINLATRIGWTPDEIRTVLRPHHNRMRHQLDRTDGDPVSFIEKVINDAIIGASAL
jgi:hypothetical protein